jgi:RND superfamily putative drug exporter
MRFPDPAPAPAGAAAHSIVRWRGWIAAAWVLVCLVVIPLGRNLDHRLIPAGRIPASESERVEHLLDQRFGSHFARYAILVATGIDLRHSGGRAALGDVVASLDTLEMVTGVFSPLTSTDTLLVGADSTGAIMVVGVAAGGRQVDAVVTTLRAATTPVAKRLAAAHPGLALRWTGEDPLNVDLKQASSDDVHQSEARALPIVGLLLLLVFGGLVAAALPIAASLLAISVSLGLGAVLAALTPMSLLFPTMVSLLGLALGIDYALLIVSRLREARRDGLDPVAATVLAVSRAGRTVSLSGATVVIGFAALLVVPVEELQSVGAGGLLVAGMSVLVATTLLPAVLVWLGRWVGPAKPGVAARRARASARWERWACLITDRPWTVLVLSSLPLLLLTWQVRRINIGLPSGDWLPARAESALAFRDLDRIGRGGVLQVVRVVLVLPDTTTAFSKAGWAATLRLTRYLEDDQRVGRVRSLPTSVDNPSRAVVRAFLADSVRDLFVSGDSSLVLAEAIPRADLPPTDAMKLVRALRGADAGAITGLPGARLVVGGLPAFNVDYEDVVGGYFWPVVALVLIGTFVALFVSFRSVLVPLKAIAMNLLTVAAACGAVVLVFQGSLGASIVGLAGPLDAVFPTLPILVFCAVFGIGMDYEVFLIARVAEARSEGLDDCGAIACGLATTGGVITSAAAIMIAVFGAFALGSFLPTKMLGFALAVAVLIDATLVRLAIGPALLQLAGRWNWWPGRAVATRPSASTGDNRLP